MREIKFRAWLGNRGMYVINGFQKHLNGITIYPLDSFGNKIDDWYRMDNETTELMQYTGIKDQDLKEVYEGDIVKGKKYGQYIIGVIQYELIHWFVNVNKNMHHLGSISHLEVIGNIYEHAHLLEVKE